MGKPITIDVEPPAAGHPTNEGAKQTITEEKGTMCDWRRLSVGGKPEQPSQATVQRQLTAAATAVTYQNLDKKRRLCYRGQFVSFD